MHRIGVLTSGGDSPGMNAAVMAVAKAARYHGMSLIGIKRGYNGTLCKSHHIEDDMLELDLDTILDIADQPGTYLRTARCLEFHRPEMRVHAVNNIREMGIEGIVVIGGDGSYHGAMELCALGVPCVGIPGTIDNDLAYTEMTLGYDTAVNSCVDDIRSIRATSRSHDRPAVVEVMGRHCGDIALKAAAGSGAEICIVPEVNWSIQEVANRLSRLIDMGNPRATVVIAEGAWDAMHPMDWHRFLRENGCHVHDDDVMNTHFLSLMLKYKCKCEARPTVLGYTQRGRTPSAYDSWFAFEAGNLAVNLLENGIGNQVIGLKDGRVYYLPIGMALQQKREFNLQLYNLINTI
ncbi:MAG: ATP-dependent 6-phosphofructokinase [Clostridia bacterium]|jgi:6-phosphofructokinase 1|nr:ATP-dependent 6-phosphofructokinase [Clostridia bacterium]